MISYTEFRKGTLKFYKERIEDCAEQLAWFEGRLKFYEECMAKGSESFGIADIEWAKEYIRKYKADLKKYRTKRTKLFNELKKEGAI